MDIKYLHAVVELASTYADFDAESAFIRIAEKNKTSNYLSVSSLIHSFDCNYDMNYWSKVIPAIRKAEEVIKGKARTDI